MNAVEQLNTQNKLLLKTLFFFYKAGENLNKLLGIVNGDSRISLRIVDWFVTNYAKKNYIVYDDRFKVYNDYKLKLKAYSKKRFDPFCRWDRIYIPYCDEEVVVADGGVGRREQNEFTMKMETTIGQLNFFKWAIENKILDYIESNYSAIEEDMNLRNSSSKRRPPPKSASRDNSNNGSSIDTAMVTCASATDSPYMKKTRKKREELSVSACKCIRKEAVKIVVKF